MIPRNQIEKISRWTNVWCGEVGGAPKMGASLGVYDVNHSWSVRIVTDEDRRNSAHRKKVGVSVTDG